MKVPSLAVPDEAGMEAMVALYDWAIQMPRATQDLAIIEFRTVQDQEGFSDDVAKALGSHSAARRAFAARLLARLYPGEHLEELLAHTVMDTSPDARKSAAEAVAVVGEPGLVAPLVRSMETSQYSIVRRNAAESLGYMGYAAAVPALVNHLATAQSSGSADIQHGYVFFGRQFAYIQDFDVEVAQFQSIADPQINVLTEGAVQQSGVVAVRQEITTVERGTVRGALERITGENPGRNTKAWLRWWEENEYRWKNETAVPPETEAAQ